MRIATAVDESPPPDPTHALERSRDYQRIEQALEWLARNVEAQPQLADAAAAVNMSPFHFQRVFTRWAGVSPKQFLQAMSLERAKRALAEGASVLDAAMRGGLSGPGRLHDAFVTVEAVTPGEYKRGLAGVVIDYGYHPSPFGECVILATARGLCGLGFVAAGERDGTLTELAARLPGARLRPNADATAALARRVFRAARGAGDDAPLKLFLYGTRFQIQVWRALLEIPAGRLVSYATIASRLGKPRAMRAVGTANGANPLAWLIPCHRVIRRTGALGGYRWGAGRKLAMLGLEAVRAG